jgi:hypothetical protein
MSRFHKAIWNGLLVGLCLIAFAVRAASSEKLHFGKALDPDDTRCLRQLFGASSWAISPEDEKPMVTDAKVARADLNGDGRKEYLYLIEGAGWCGTAGCPLLIGEMRQDGICHLLFDDMGGDYDFEVLRRRDHGYRRLYTPCEARFDGQEYRQVREECPNLDVPR